jgi:simple sugar transport system substrate-binding protein
MAPETGRQEPGARRRQPLAIALAAAALTLPLTAGAASAKGDGISIYFVGCAAPTGFHGYLARGAEEAGKNLGVKVTYIYPDQLTIPNQVQKIEEAIAAQADGIALCEFAEDAAYTDVAARAKEAGIAFGSAAAPPAGSQVRDPNDIFLFRTGSDERAAGRLTAQTLISMGVKGRVVVGDQQPGDATCRDRADAEIETLKAAGVEADFLELTMDPGQQSEALFNYLRKNPDTAAATSVCDVIDGFLSAKADSGRDDLVLTGYDIVAQALDAIRDGREAFTIDQQQFWRGYMPVLLLTHYIKYGLVEANYFLTGPTIVDKSTVDQVAKLVEEGYR